MKESVKMPKLVGQKMEEFIKEVYFAGIKEGIRMVKENPCENSDPEDMCENCNCWKAFRKSCS
jgi:hypothetical protein